MAIQSFSVSALTDIPAAVYSFISANGWTVDAANVNAPKIKNASGLEYILSATATELSLAPVVAGSPSCKTKAPVLYSGTANYVPSPTAVDVIVGSSPQPYLAFVVSFGPNLYRHLYFGYMEKIGGYTGGEVLSATNLNYTPFSTAGFAEQYAQHLFRGHGTPVGAGEVSGGVRVAHANNPQTWRHFMRAAPSTLAAYTDFDVVGGFGDGIANPLVQYGKSPFAGGNILVPNNLFAVLNDGVFKFVPIGRPAGVRLLNIADIDPGASLTVGSETWKCYPALSKKASTSSDSGGGNPPTSESSYTIGYAYKVS